MRATTSRRRLIIAAVAGAVILVWLLVRAAQGGPGPVRSPAADRSAGHSVTATSGTGPAQRHTASGNVTTGARDPVSGLPWVNESALPPEAEDTLRLIRAGGPFPYPRSDNQTFENRERLLPGEPQGYYKEFTVLTPQSSDRGPRRIIQGAGGELYWTADHYVSFSRIREGA